MICIIDRQYDAQNSLPSLLKSLDVTIRLFADAEAFLKVFAELDIACLILEMKLPGMDGIQLVKQLKQQGFEVPTIMLASSSEIPEAVEAIRIGCIDFIEKPYIESVLLKKVRLALDKFQQSNSSTNLKNNRDKPTGNTKPDKGD